MANEVFDMVTTYYQEKLMYLKKSVQDCVAVLCYALDERDYQMMEQCLTHLETIVKEIN